MSAPSMSAADQAFAKHGLEILGLPVGHGKAHDNPALFHIGAERGQVTPSDKADHVVGNLDANTADKQTLDRLRLGQWRVLVGHKFVSIASETLDQFVHVPLPNLERALHAAFVYGGAKTSRWLIADAAQ